MNNFTDENLMLQSIERYLDGTMLPDEKAYFEQLRKNTPEIDQMVVEHSMFLHQMETYSANRNIRNTLHDVHSKLIERGDVNEGGELNVKGKVIQIYHRYKKVTAIAATVGGLIALVISALVAYISPSVDSNQLRQLSKDIEVIKRNQQVQSNLINEVKGKLPDNAKFISGGTGFLVDGKGYIITNAHVLKGSGAIVVDSKGNELNADIISIDHEKDLALLKITDEDFKPIKSLPYTIEKGNAEIGEEIYTLGYPRNEIVYTHGYLSAKTGFNGDTTNYQIQMSSNPGNSGGPIINNNGEIIGVLSAKQVQADGVTFAVKSENIYRFIETLRKTDSSLQKIKIASGSFRNKERMSQIKQIQDYVYLVKAFTNK